MVAPLWVLVYLSVRVVGAGQRISAQTSACWQYGQCDSGAALQQPHRCHNPGTGPWSYAHVRT